MADDAGAGEDRPSTFEVWKEYESVAVHFNDLIMRLRVQALGGVAALAAVAGIVMNGAGPGHMRWTLMAVASAVLIVFWLAVFCLDYFYYTRLLYGAVDAILDLEKQSGAQAKWKVIDLSSRIRVSATKWFLWRKEMLGPVLFYGLVLLGLVIMLLFAYSQSGQEKVVDQVPPAVGAKPT